MNELFIGKAVKMLKIQLKSKMSRLDESGWPRPRLSHPRGFLHVTLNSSQNRSSFCCQTWWVSKYRDVECAHQTLSQLWSFPCGALHSAADTFSLKGQLKRDHSFAFQHFLLPFLIHTEGKKEESLVMLIFSQTFPIFIKHRSDTGPRITAFLFLSIWLNQCLC